MDKYNIKEIEEKLERCKNIPLSEINLDDLKDIKIRKKNLKKRGYWIL